MGAGRIENAGPDLRDEPVVKRLTRPASQCAQDGAHGSPDVLTCGLAALDVDVHAAELAAGVQLVAERKERRRLPRLPRRVQDEVLPLPDEQQEVVHVQPRQGRDVVVHLRDDGAGGVEETHRPSIARRLRPRRAANDGGCTSDSWPPGGRRHNAFPPRTPRNRTPPTSQIRRMPNRTPNAGQGAALATGARSGRGVARACSHSCRSSLYRLKTTCYIHSGGRRSGNFPVPRPVDRL